MFNLLFVFFDYAYLGFNWYNMVDPFCDGRHDFLELLKERCNFQTKLRAPLELDDARWTPEQTLFQRFSSLVV